MLELLTEYHQVEECHSELFASCHSERSEESPPAIAVRRAGQRSFALLRMTP